MTGRCRELNCHAMVIRPLHYCTKHADKEAAYQASRAETERADSAATAGAKSQKLKIRYDVEWWFP